MSTYKGFSKIWLLGLLLVAFVAGCGDHKSNALYPSSAKAITAYSIAGVPGTIDDAAKTISVSVPKGTNVTALVATFEATGKSVEVGTQKQISGTTTNDFTLPVEYTVTAGNKKTATYTVTVNATGLSSAKTISAYSVAGAAGTINKTTRAIAVTLPYSTPSVTALVATFTKSATAAVMVGTTTQISNTTANDFTAPVEYTVTAADGTSVIYTVTVTKALINDKAITAYSLRKAAGTIGEGTNPKTIAVTLPIGTNVTALAATFLTNGELVTVGTTTQTSGTTANDFTSPVDYTVTAGNGSTATYTVTVILAGTAAAGPDAVDLGTAGNFAILAKTGVSATGVTHVTGDLGVSPAAASYITGFGLTADPSNVFSTSPLVTGQVFAANYAVPTPSNLTTAISDMETAFTDAAGRPLPDFTELYAGDISGQTLVPGLYKWGTGVLITSAGVTLTGSADDVWIFQIAQNLTVGNGAIITLGGAAQAKNIFWQVSGQATLGTTADFKGIILCQTLISLNTGATVNGRLLSQTAVTLNASTVTEP